MMSDLYLPLLEHFLLTNCIIAAKWDSQEEEDVKTKYKITWSGNPCHNER